VNHLGVLGTYNLSLVVLSLAIAVFASYIALDLAGRVKPTLSAKRARPLWLLGGAIAMGTGIWAMHFVGHWDLGHALCGDVGLSPINACPL
jgi:NO-binding membrane sensor protein with MHYT domain